MNFSAAKIKEWIELLKTGTVNKLDDFAELIKTLNSLDADYPFPEAQRLVTKCRKNAIDAKNLVLANQSEAANILDADEGERNVCMATMAAYCACFSFGLGAAVGVGAMESMGARVAWSLFLNGGVQAGLQSANAYMNYQVTGDCQVSMKVLTPNVLFNLACSGGMGVIQQLEAPTKVALHLCRIALLVTVNDAVRQSKNQKIFSNFKQIPRTSVLKELPEVKRVGKETAKYVGESICLQIWKDTINVDRMNEIFSQVAEAVKDIPKLHWMTQVFTFGNPQKELDQAVKRVAQFAMEAHLYTTLAGMISYQKTKFQLIAAGYDNMTVDKLYMAP